MRTSTLIAFVVTTVSLVAAVFGLNTCVDPAGLRTVDAVEALANAQKDDEILIGPAGFDQRAWVRGRIGECTDVLIIGSSTLGMLEQRMFDRPLLNAWLSGPTVEDFEALTVLLERSGCRPSRIVVGIDPWFVNPLVDDQRWRTLAEETRAFAGASRLERVYDSARAAWELVHERLNFATTRRSVEIGSVVRPYLTREPDCASLDGDANLRARDGHFLRCGDPSDVERIATSYLDRDFHRMRSWREIDALRLRRLEGVVRRLAAVGSVTIVAPPYHPTTYALLRRERSVMLDELDSAIRVIGDRTGARYLVLRNPASLGCTSQMFADSHHAKPACAGLLAARLRP